MKLYNYKKKDAYFASIEIAKEIQNASEYSYRRELIEDYLRKYTLLEYEKAPKTHFLWRFTILFYWLFFLILLIYMPFKWMLTGQSGYQDTKWVIRLNENWAKKLGI